MSIPFYFPWKLSSTMCGECGEYVLLCRVQSASTRRNNPREKSANKRQHPCTPFTYNPGGGGFMEHSLWLTAPAVSEVRCSHDFLSANSHFKWAFLFRPMIYVHFYCLGLAVRLFGDVFFYFCMLVSVTSEFPNLFILFRGGGCVFFRLTLYRVRRLSIFLRRERRPSWLCKIEKRQAPRIIRYTSFIPSLR
jgi:hypothetical protein